MKKYLGVVVDLSSSAKLFRLSVFADDPAEARYFVLQEYQKRYPAYSIRELKSMVKVSVRKEQSWFD